jgi:hypothetical protein
MRRLQIITLSVSIFAITAFGINQCAALFHKAETAGLWRNIQISWNRSLIETGKEFNSLNTLPINPDDKAHKMMRKAIETGLRHGQYHYQDHEFGGTDSAG